MEAEALALGSGAPLVRVSCFFPLKKEIEQADTKAGPNIAPF